MLQIPLDCPHCGTKKVAATITTAFASTLTEVAAFGACNNCYRGVIIYGESKALIPAVYVRKVLAEVDRNWAEIVEKMTRTGIAPEPPQPRQIGHLPIPVENAFREAEENFADKRFASAAMGYRRSIERTLKTLVPDTKGMLNTRIRALEKENALPHTLIQLMDSVKFLGNDGAHDLDDPEPDDVVTGRDFTALLLTYLFEMPARVRLATEKRSN